MTYHLAVDLGASSGRLIIGWIEEGKIKYEEIHRFPNAMVNNGGILCWDYQKLFDEICLGMRKCKEKNLIPSTMSIDTWGVDFVLLDYKNEVIGETAAYRDSRTEGMEEVVAGIIPPAELYARTGIQKAIYNTINQLTAIKTNTPERLERAECMLMTPQYFDFLLTGIKKCEYTIATTTQLVNAETRTWDFDIIDRLGFPKRIFLPITHPGTTVGNLMPDIKKAVGFDCMVIQAASHDTGSAVLSVPVTDERKFLYISSGTWSLMGIELERPNTLESSRVCNFTNEGGYGCRYRFLKNIMGLWMIQSIRKELSNTYTFAQLCDMARAEADYDGVVNVDDPRFLAPESMIEAIKAVLKENNQMIPRNAGELARCVYYSLAESYARTVEQLEMVSGDKYDCINIVGGGCNAEYLNKLTARLTGKTVYAGPSEATAVGNLTSQMIASGEFKSIQEARRVIAESFELKEYH